MERPARALWQVLLEDRVIDDGGPFGPRRRELAREPVGHVRALDHGRHLVGEPNGAAQTCEARGLIGPHGSEQGEPPVLRGRVDGPAVAAPALGHDQRRGQMKRRLEPMAFEVDGAIRGTPGGAAAPVAEAVGAQVQARAGSHFEEAQGEAGGLGRFEQPEGQAGRPAHFVRLAGQGHEGTQGLWFVGDEMAQGRPGGLGVDRGSGAFGRTRARQVQRQFRRTALEGEAVSGGHEAQAKGIAARAGCGVGLEEGEGGAARPGVLGRALEEGGVKRRAHDGALTRLVPEQEGGARAIRHGADLSPLQ